MAMGNTILILYIKISRGFEQLFASWGYRLHSKFKLEIRLMTIKLQTIGHHFKSEPVSISGKLGGEVGGEGGVRKRWKHVWAR